MSVEPLPACPGCSKQTVRHCDSCGWLVCKRCDVVYGSTNSFRYSKADREEKAKRRQNGG